MRNNRKPKNKILYQSGRGSYHLGDSINLLSETMRKNLQGRVQLILTSPPFPLNNKKSYGNLNGDEYKKWFAHLAELFSDLITDDGSIVIEIGNSWAKDKPIQSLLHLESLLGFVNNPQAHLNLCQEFICYNPSRLPSPAQWVTVNRIRTVDSFTHIWWMSKSEYPKADNKRILRPYSESMKALLKRQTFNSGKRPSEHSVSKKGFLKKHRGSIMHNVIELEQMDDKREVRLPTNMLSISNTKSNDYFMKTCRSKKITPHPARMPEALASFFINFLTDKNDLVLDPFAGSNTTGYCAEKLGRKWLSFEQKKEYGKQALIRFKDPSLDCKIQKKR